MLLLAIALGATYAYATPPWQAPDEPAHFHYVQTIADGALPVLQAGDWDAALLDELKSLRFPPGRSVESLRYESHQPPLYYLLAAPVALATASWPIADQVRALRLYSVSWAIVLLVIAGAVVRTVLPESPGLALAVPALIAVIPQHTAIAASVNNDILAEVILSLVLLALAHRIVHGIPQVPRTFLDQLARPAGLGMLLGLALLTKTTVYAVALLIPLGLMVAPASSSGGRSPSTGSRPGEAPSETGHGLVRLVFGQLLVVAGIAFIVASWWFVRNAVVYGGWDITGLLQHDAVVVGQPRTGPLTPALVGSFLLTTFRSFWVQPGWMAVPAEDWVYVLLGGLTGFALVGLVLYAVRSVRQTGVLSNRQGLALGIGITAAVLVTLQLVGYNLQFVQPQGRYLFPAIVPIALLLLLGLRELVAPRYHVLGCLSLLTSLLSLNVYTVQRLIPYLYP